MLVKTNLRHSYSLRDGVSKSLVSGPGSGVDIYTYEITLESGGSGEATFCGAITMHPGKTGRYVSERAFTVYAGITTAPSARIKDFSSVFWLSNRPWWCFSGLHSSQADPTNVGTYMVTTGTQCVVPGKQCTGDRVWDDSSETTGECTICPAETPESVWNVCEACTGETPIWDADSKTCIEYCLNNNKWDGSNCVASGCDAAKPLWVPQTPSLVEVDTDIDGIQYCSVGEYFESRVWINYFESLGLKNDEYECASECSSAPEILFHEGGTCYCSNNLENCASDQISTVDSKWRRYELTHPSTDGACKACTGNTPWWDGTSCKACPAGTPKWDGTDCVACTGDTTWWDGTDCVGCATKVGGENDPNGDGEINVRDIVRVVNIMISGGIGDACTDVNKNGGTDVRDVVELVNIILVQ